MNPYNFQSCQGPSNSIFTFSKTIASVLPEYETIKCEYCDNAIDKNTSKCLVCNSSINEMPSRKVYIKNEISKGYKTVQVDTPGSVNPFHKLPKVKKEWECHNCHTSNLLSALYCKRCLCKKRYSKTESNIPLKRQKLDEWSCSKCSFVNPNSSHNCVVCFQSR